MQKRTEPEDPIEEVGDVVEPETKRQVVEPLYAKNFARSLVHHGTFRGGKFGLSGSRSYGPKNRKLEFLLPTAEMIFAPDPWTEEKQAKYGKAGTQLAPDRKFDRWNATFRFIDPQNYDIFREMTKQLREELFEFQREWWKGERFESAAELKSKVVELFSLGKDGQLEFSVSMLSKVGSPSPDCEFRDAKTMEQIRQEKVGRYSRGNLLVDFSNVFIPEQNAAKIYASLRVFYVKELREAESRDYGAVLPQFEKAD